MHLDELKSILDSSGLPAAYHHWARGVKPSLPYVIFARTDSETNGSDNGCEVRHDTYLIELYTKSNRDLAAEEKLEKVLDEAGIHYYCDEDYLSDQDIFVLSYEVEFYFRR